MFSYFSILAPGPPVGVSVSTLNSTSLKVIWKAPTDPNGIIVGYKVFYTFTVNDLGEDVNKETKVKEFTDNSTLEFVIVDLGMDHFHMQICLDRKKVMKKYYKRFCC